MHCCFLVVIHRWVVLLILMVLLYGIKYWTINIMMCTPEHVLTVGCWGFCEFRCSGGTISISINWTLSDNYTSNIYIFTIKIKHTGTDKLRNWGFRGNSYLYYSGYPRVLYDNIYEYRTWKEKAIGKAIGKTIGKTIGKAKRSRISSKIAFTMYY